MLLLMMLCVTTIKTAANRILNLQCKKNPRNFVSSCHIHTSDLLLIPPSSTSTLLQSPPPFTNTLLLKLVIVLLSSIAMVMGPTPPGTGVIAPANAKASAETSPTVRLPG